MLRLSRELQQTDGSSVTESYYYYVETCMDGRERVHIRYKADLRTEDSPVQIDPVGGRRWPTHYNFSSVAQGKCAAQIQAY